MSQQVTLKAKGLNTSPNSLEVADGSMNLAKNVIIRRQDIIEPRRGFKLYGDGFPLTTDRAKQLFEYQNLIIRHYSNKLQYDNGTGTFSTFAGNYLETESGLRIKTIDSNGNFYFTTSDGIKKISALSASDFTTDAGFITQAGGVKALDVNAVLNIQPGNQTGFLPEDSAVAYRILWATKDVNSNLILGTPSQRAEIYNNFQPLIILDVNSTLNALDTLSIDPSGTLITDADYSDFTLASNATANQLKINIVALASKLDNDISLANGTGAGVPLTITTVVDNGSNSYTINFSGAPDLSKYFSVGSLINLSNFTTTTGTINGPQTILLIDDTADFITILNPTAATGNATAIGDVHSYNYTNIIKTAGPNQTHTLDALIVDTPTPNQELTVIQDAIERIILQLQGEPTGIISASLQNDFIAPLTITTSATVDLSFTIPKEINSTYFYQVYRSDIIAAEGTAVLTDLEPNDEMKLVYEGYPTEQQLENGIVTLQDITPEGFRGTNLYTNQASGEGILQANDIPPFAKDLNRFKNCIFYSNTKTKQSQQYNLLGVSDLIQDYNNGIIPKIVISDGTKTAIYEFTIGVQEVLSGTFTADVANSYNGKYFTLNTANNESQYLFYYQTSAGTDTPPSTGGTITAISVSGTTTVTSNSHGLQTGDKISISNTDSVPVIDGTYYVTVTGANTFTIPLAVTETGEVGSWTRNATIQKIGIKTAATNAEVAQATKEAIQVYSANFTTSNLVVNSFTITNVQAGATQAPGNGSLPAGSSLSVTTPGSGEDAAQRKVLLSQLVSPSQAVDATARSLVRVINQDTTSPVYAFYLSGSNSVPGQFQLQSRDLNTDPFYVVANNPATGQSFNPDISPLLKPVISAINAATDVLTTNVAHRLNAGDKVVIVNSDTTPNIDGVHTVSNVLTTTTFKIGVDITNAGSGTASYNTTKNLQPSTNEERKNRVYYSKLNQPEAVPSTNYFDVGASDKAILRIFPLRDSLFVFKEDGLYRISGESAPFSLALFDSSCFLLAPDSIGVTNNTIYCWTTQGVSTVTESGVDFAVSRAIDNQILKVQTPQFTNFKTATFGVGYESDNSYIVWTVQDISDSTATIAYRYTNLTDSWTIYDKSNTCGFVNKADDKLYLGASDTYFIEQERKSFDRYDYADREITKSIDTNKLIGNTVQFSSVSDINIGDVLVQEQTLTSYTFNRLLEKLDLDVSVANFHITNIPIANQQVIITNSGTNNLSVGDYVKVTGSNSTPSIDGTYLVLAATSTTFTVSITAPILIAGTSASGRYLYSNSLSITTPGLSARDKLVSLAAKLDGDPGINDTDYSVLIQARTGVSITGNSIGNPTTVTSTGHGLITGRVINIQSNTGSISSINGNRTVTVINANTFTIPVNVTTAGTGGLFNTVEDNFNDIKTCYNAIIAKLNSDIGVISNNFKQIAESTTFEAIVVDKNTTLKTVTLDQTLDFFVGPATIYAAIDCQLGYTPITMNDPLNWKHLYEATLMFTDRSFTSATLSFATDLLPQFTDVPFRSDGNGAFGGSGFGSGFFGGGSHSAPLRTYIPRAAQRCRYIMAKFSHKIAREKWELLGITITGNINESSRAYRK